ncbi:hypothetical protein PAEPH01_2474 [Pancytospora epiphaga]|nr:hypothetical protein PAEPH01_2474 [Pancytospora epiphaga]
MVSVVPHINTLIVDVGTEFTKIGYAGDHHPILRVRTCSMGEPVIVESKIANVEGFVDIVHRYVEQESVDSIIIITHSSTDDSEQDRISQRLIDRNVCGSFYFMKSSVCEVFGTARVSGTVLSCSAGSTCISIVINGTVVEHYAVDNADIQESLIPLQKTLADFDSAAVNNKIQEIKEVVFPLTEPVDISDILRRKCSFAFKIEIKKYYEIIDRLMKMREKHGLIKTMINGTILFTGGYFQNKKFFSLCKEYLVSKHGSNMGELVVTDGSLNLCFTGASIFGMNIESKTLFITNPKRVSTFV